MADTSTKSASFWAEHRLWIIIASILILLPPLSFLFQFTQDSNFCGSWCPRMFFSWRKGQAASDFFLGFARSYMGVTLVLGVLASTFFLGRYWCSHLCPVGGTMETGSRIVPKWLKINFSAIPAPPVRYGYFAVYMLAPAVGLGSLCCNYCNFATVPRMFGAAFFNGADFAYFLRTAGLINLGLIVVFGFLAKGGRAYCNFMCPIGAMDSLSNRLGLKFGRRMNVDQSKCNSCGACSRVCPTWAIEIKDKAAIDHYSCMPCRKCEKACAKGAIAYGKTQG
ncbi:MAG: 4Fe-4S binding protein [Nitrospirae bacterium]|nr:4Fe-4S binding protein [Nitrospirota bacterium]